MNGPSDLAPDGGRRPWLLHAITTAIILFVAFLALGDIAAGQEPSFAFEYAVLVGFAVWLLVLSVRLARHSHPLYGALSLAAVLVGTLAFGTGITDWGPQHVAVWGAFGWFTLLALALFWLDWCPPRFRARTSSNAHDVR